MRPAMTTWLFNAVQKDKRMSFAEIVKYIARTLQATSIEIPRTTYGDWSLSGVRELKRIVFREGLEIASIAAQNHFNELKPEIRRREVLLSKEFVDIAAFLGARTLNIFHAGWGDREQGRRLKPEMLECMREVAYYAEGKGVVLALESHGPLTDNAAEMKEILAGVGCEALGVTLDTGNFYEGPEACLQLLDVATHVHVKPEYRDLQKQKHDAEVKKVLTALKGAGYNGPVTLEQIDGDALEVLPKVFGEFRDLIASL